MEYTVKTAYNREYGEIKLKRRFDFLDDEYIIYVNGIFRESFRNEYDAICEFERLTDYPTIKISQQNRNKPDTAIGKDDIIPLICFIAGVITGLCIGYFSENNNQNDTFE